MALFVRISPLAGRENHRESGVDPGRVEEWEPLGPAAPRVQDAFPELGAQDQEFLIAGIAPGEWDEPCGQGDDETEDERAEAGGSKVEFTCMNCQRAITRQEMTRQVHNSPGTCDRGGLSVARETQPDRLAVLCAGEVVKLGHIGTGGVAGG